MITISLNGKITKTKANITIAQLVKELGYSDGFAVAVNTTFVPISKYEQTILKEADTIDILSAIQGG